MPLPATRPVPVSPLRAPYRSTRSIPATSRHRRTPLLPGRLRGRGTRGTPLTQRWADTRACGFPGLFGTTGGRRPRAERSPAVNPPHSAPSSRAARPGGPRFRAARDGGDHVRAHPGPPAAAPSPSSSVGGASHAREPPVTDLTRAVPRVSPRPYIGLPTQYRLPFSNWRALACDHMSGTEEDRGQALTAQQVYTRSTTGAGRRQPSNGHYRAR